MIYITSDIHIPNDVKKIGSRAFSARLSVTEADTLIVCGDFGGVWSGGNTEKYWLNWLSKKPFTTVFIDGNHENHRRLAEEFPVVDFCGGRAHRIRKNIYHLMRGYVFEIEGRRIFAMGGAVSHDRKWRQEGLNWWPEELPSMEEYTRAQENLNACGWQVDYVISHCAPESIQRRYFPAYEENVLTAFLEEISQRLEYRRWYFGHYHRDEDINERHACLYDRVIPLE